MSHNIVNTYEHYLEQEKIYSKIFMEKAQIYDERFDEDEFFLIKALWSDQCIINKIYCVIDDILLSLNIHQNMRFLVLGDFLLSLTSADLVDPSEILLKIDRNSYLSRIRMRAIINTTFELDYSIYIIIHQKLLIGLRLDNVLERNQIRNKKENIWSTTVYYRFITKKDFFIEKKIFGISKKPFVIINFMDTKYSIGTFRNIWKIKRKKREMDDVKISYTGIIRASQFGFTLSKKSYEIIKNHYENEKELILKEVECLDFNEYMSNLKKKILDDRYHKKIIDTVPKIENNIVLYTKHFQKLISFELLKGNIYDKIFYLPCFADNRGRQYYGTLLSPTFYIIFRYLYDFEKKENKLLQYSLENSRFYNKIMNYKSLVESFSNKYKIYLILILYIEVGKFFIKKGSNYFIKTKDIILLGKEKYAEKNRNLDFEDILYVEKIYNTLDNIINNDDINDDIIIFKDATASGLQNYGILLEYQFEKLKYLNIDGEDWCDTYQYLINKFLEGDDIYKKRKYWKSTIMTIPYNSTWFSCFTKFIDALKCDNIIYNNLAENERLLLKKMHKNFYDNIKNNVKSEFYVHNKANTLNIYKYSHWKVVSIEEYKINYKKARDKYKNTLYMLLDDEQSTFRAMEANNMHYLDAELVRYVLNKVEAISVHDCFGVRLSEIHILIDTINDYYSKILKKSTYSIHILL